MGIKITSVDELDPELVEQAQAELTQLIQEKWPEVELQRGVIHDIVAYFAGGISGGINQTEINRLQRSSSLLEITRDPALADDELADRVFSNFRVARAPGTPAAGEVTVVVGADATIVVPADTAFDASGHQYRITSATTVRPVGGATTSPTDRILQPRGDGTFSFSVAAVATEPGAGGNIARNTKFTLSAVLPKLITAFASTDFAGGRDTETNEEVLRRLESGIAAKAWSNRANITALLREQPQFTRIPAVSIVGFGNPEMARDRHWIFPVSGGGRTDVYARTQGLPSSRMLPKEATFVAATADGGIWQFAVGRDDFPGFYEVEQVLLPADDPEATEGFEVVMDRRGFDLSIVPSLVPDVADAQEAAFSRFQTAVVRFLDTVTPVAGLVPGETRAKYNVALAGMPLIAQLQDFCGGSDTRNIAGDVLVKAAVPCFLTLNFDIRKAPDAAMPDMDAIRDALAERVNFLGFPGQLHASLVAEIVHDLLPERAALGAIDMHGRILLPGGGTRFIRDAAVLRIPDDPGNLVTGNTTAFILHRDNIGISIVVEGFSALA